MNQQKTILFAISVLFSAYFCSAQDSIRNPFIYNQSAFSVQYTIGFNNPKVTPTFGNDNRFLTLISQVHQLNLLYTFDLNQTFGLTVGAGIGMFPFNYELVQTDDFIGTTGLSKKFTRTYTPFSRIHVMLDYHRWLGNKVAFSGGLGGGFYKFTPSYMSAGSGTYSTQQYYISVQYPGKFTPNFSAKAGLDFKLKNDDLIMVSISYDYLLGNILAGAYGIQNSEHRGFIANNGNQFNVNLTYTFTRAQKRLAIENGFYKENKTMDEARFQFKKDKRYIDPKSIFLNTSIGFFGARNKVTDNFPFMKSASIIGEIFAVNLEIGHKENRFFQLGLNRAQYYTANHLVLFPEKYGSGTSGGTLFKAIQFSAGYGIRLITKNNINLLNISGGLGLNFNNGTKGTGVSLLGSMTEDNGDLVYTLDIYGDLKRKIYPTAYLNLSRDFQLTKNLYFTVDYRYNLGALTTYQENISIHKQPDLSQQYSGTSKIKGTGYAFQIGIKYKFVPKY